MNWSEALFWGTIIVAVILGMLGASFFLVRYFLFA